MANHPMTTECRVSIIVPAYNEEGNIGELCHQFNEMGKVAEFSFEVVIVDDGSTDGTRRLLAELERKYDFLRVETHGRNQGLTDALQTGFTAANGEIFVFYPADLQYKPEDIPRMIAPFDKGYDVVTGWKQGKYSKQFVSNIYNALSRRLFGLQVHDLNSVKAFRRDVVENVFLRRDWHRYLVALAAQQGYRITEVKIPLYPRYSGNSKFAGFWRIPIGVLDLLAVKSQMSLLRKPLMFFGFLGTSLIGLGILVGLVAIYLRFVLETGLRPLLYLVLLLVMLGASLFILGFLAESLAGMQEEISAMRKTMMRLEKRNRRDDSSQDQDTPS